MGTSGEAGGRRAATLRDVAATAEVSIRTVSNVVTGAVPVRDATRQRVESVIADLGYRPNLAARRLRSGRSHVIGLVIPDITVPYFREFADAVLVAARDVGMAVVVEQTHGLLERERGILTNPRLRHVDGIILTAVTLAPEETADLVSTRPVVLAGATVRSDAMDSVAPDAYAAGRAVADLATRAGSAHPAIIAPGDTRWPVERSDRFRGFVDGLAAQGIPLEDDHTMIAREVTLLEGKRLARELAARSRDVDLVFALGDALALGALRGLQEVGRRVPDDIAVIGYGNVEHGAHATPTLSTVDSGRTATAAGAVGVILGRLDGKTARKRSEASGAPRRVTVPFEVIERESTRVTR